MNRLLALAVAHPFATAAAAVAVVLVALIVAFLLTTPLGYQGGRS